METPVLTIQKNYMSLQPGDVFTFTEKVFNHIFSDYPATKDNLIIDLTAGRNKDTIFYARLSTYPQKYQTFLATSLAGIKEQRSKVKQALKRGEHLYLEITQCDPYVYGSYDIDPQESTIHYFASANTPIRSLHDLLRTFKKWKFLYTTTDNTSSFLQEHHKGEILMDIQKKLPLNAKDVLSITSKAFSIITKITMKRSLILLRYDYTENILITALSEHQSTGLSL